MKHWAEAASIEAAEKDPVREIESVAGLLEATSRLRDKEATQRHLQRLIDLVQTQNAPLDVAQTAIARATREWLSIEGVETASELFAVLLILSAAESVGEDPHALVTAIARQAFVVFHLVRNEDRDLVDQLDKATRKRLKRRFGTSAAPLIEIMTAMRPAAEKKGKS